MPACASVVMQRFRFTPPPASSVQLPGVLIMACSVRPTLRVVPLLLLLQGALVAPMSIAAPTGGTRSFDVKFRRDGEEHTLRVPEGMPVLQVARLPTACRTPHL